MTYMDESWVFDPDPLYVEDIWLAASDNIALGEAQIAAGQFTRLRDLDYPGLHKRGCPRHVHRSQRDPNVIATCTCGGIRPRRDWRYLALIAAVLLAIAIRRNRS